MLRRIRPLEPNTLRLVQDTLLAAGYRPIATGDLREVARIIGTKRPRLVLLDLMLPRPMVPTRVLGGVRSVNGRPQVGHPGAT